MYSTLSKLYNRGAQNADNPPARDTEKATEVEERAQEIEEVKEEALQLVEATSQLQDHEIRQIENALALQMVRELNSFETEEEKVSAIQMAALAALMYRGIENIDTIQDLFDQSLALLPTPHELGITLTKGLAVQAFRHRGRIIFAIRGTELTKDCTTMAANLIADMGIGRHKTNEDLISSIKTVNDRVASLYNFSLSKEQLDIAASVINTRATGDDDTSRVLATAKKVGKSSVKSGTLGGLGFALGASTLAVISLPAAAIAVPTAAAIGALTGMIKGVAAHASEIITLADGYQTTIDYIRQIDAYIAKLKEIDAIQEGDTIVTTGHSLAGYLSGVIGYMHAEEAYSFNGPGVTQEEVERIIRNLNRERTVNRELDYRTISMAGDFIGNLGKRDGKMTLLILQQTFKEAFEGIPACEYTSPLAHHGIKLIQGILQHMPVQGQEHIIYLRGEAEGQT